MTAPSPAPQLPPLGLFIAGSDTEVGKTHVACAIGASLVEQGVRVGVYKPAASGARREGQQLISEDAELLWEAAGRPLSLSQVCPQVFAAPLAPNLAAAAEGRQIDRDLLTDGAAAWTGQCDVLLVEGAGGLMSPLSDEDYVADVAWQIGYPLLVVVPNQLGVINQTLQTLITAATFRDGLEVAGVVLNHPRPAAAADASLASNAQQIRDRCVPPLLAELPHGAKHFDPPVDWLKVISS